MAPATRGMVVTILYRMAGEPEVKSAMPFTDVKEGQYYAKAVTWAYENGIAMGYDRNPLCPQLRRYPGTDRDIPVPVCSARRTG